MNVPFLDIAAAYVELQREIDAAVSRAVASGRYILGPEVEAFEREFAAYCGARHCVGVGNGLDALHLILRAMDIGAGDEVVVPAHTFIATWLAVSQTGATPVPVEPDQRTYNIDPSRIEAAITARTRAIIAVHLYGQPADMDPICALAAHYHIRVIEDAAQAHGARYKGRRVGNLSDAAAFSFYPAKNLGALGDGGAVVTDDAAIAERVRRARNYGSQTKYLHDIAGCNSRLDEIQAAVLRVKLRRLDEWNARRVRVGQSYLAGLGDVGWVLPWVPDWAEPVWHLFVVRTAQRADVQQRLEEAGVGTLIHYPLPIHRQAAYRKLRVPADGLPISERIAAEVLSLPMGPHLTPEQVTHVCAAAARAAPTRSHVA